MPKFITVSGKYWSNENVASKPLFTEEQKNKHFAVFNFKVAGALLIIIFSLMFASFLAKKRRTPKKTFSQCMISSPLLYMFTHDKRK